jgi:hypothetical protein
MTRRHFTAWLTNDPSMLDQPNMDVAIIEDILTGDDADDPRAWSSSSNPQPFYAVTDVPARDDDSTPNAGDARKGIEAAETLMRAAGWRVVSDWTDTPSAYVATVEHDEIEGVSK